MNTRMALFVALSGSMLGMAGTAKAAPTFTALEMDIVCPGFDNDKKGPDKDDQPLWDLSRRVYQGAIMGEKEPCDKIKTGEEGWLYAKVVWSSRNNANLYTETTAIYVGEKDNKTRRFELFLDGNGSPADFAAKYVAAGTNIMNEPGLTFSVYITDGDKDDYGYGGAHYGAHKHDGNCDKEHDHDHDGKCDHRKCDNHRHDGRCDKEHDHDHDGRCDHREAEEAHNLKCDQHQHHSKGCKDHDHDHDGKCDHHLPGDDTVLLTQQTVKPVPWALWALHSADSTNLQVQIDGLVRSVSGAAPITSTGGINPVIGLAPCGEGEGYVFTNGQWACSAGNGVAKAKAVYNRNQANCGAADNLLTTASSCSYDTGCKFDSPPACADGCNFSQTSSSQVCTRPRYNCDPFGGCTIVGCDAYQTQICGSCACPYQFAGYTIK